MKKIYLLGFIFIYLFVPFIIKAQVNQAPKPFMSHKIFNDFINIHFDYPEKDIINRNEGKFILQFKTNKKGQVIEKNILHSVSTGTDSIAMDIFKKILWLPVDYSGNKGEGDGIFTLKFKLRKFEKLIKKRGYRHIVVPYYPIDKSFRIYKPDELDKKPKAIIGEYKSLNDYIYSQLVYPMDALKQNISGTVTISFIIEVNGLPSNMHVITPVGAGCTAEAISVIENIKWMPGRKNGKSVRSLQILKITFALKRQKNGDFIPSQNQEGIMH